MDRALTWTELLERVPVGGLRPDATLKRLRRAGLLPKPTPKSLGRGYGTAQLYPAWAEERLRRIVALRSGGVRNEAELRWWLWFEGSDDLWPLVQRDLVASYPRALQAALDELIERDPEAVEDAIDQAATELAASWDSPRQPGYNRRRIRTATEAQDLATIAIEMAVPGDKPDLSALAEDGSAGTVGDLLDRAWGEGSADAAEQLIVADVGHPEAWGAALSAASPAEARAVARMISRRFSAEAVNAEARRFQERWTDRSLHIGGLLFAVQRGANQPIG